MTFALACGRDPVDAFRYGIAAGAAAVLTPGTDLCHRDEVERLYALVDPGGTPVEASTSAAAPEPREAEPHRA